MEKIKIEHVSKVFGKHIPQALELVKQQKSKTDILKETGATVGVYDASFTVISIVFSNFWFVFLRRMIVGCGLGGVIGCCTC